MACLEFDGGVLVFGGVNKVNQMQSTAYLIDFDFQHNTYNARLLEGRQLRVPDRFVHNQVMIDYDRPQ